MNLYEASAIDGAGKWKQFIYITIPMITPVIFYNLVTQLCESFQEFNSAYLITKGGPLGSTTLISMLVYQNAFKSYECFLLGKHTVERVCSGLSPLRRDRLWC